MKLQKDFYAITYRVLLDDAIPKRPVWVITAHLASEVTGGYETFKEAFEERERLNADLWRLLKP